MASFANRLIAWQRAHGRNDLPWQGAEVYQIWLSEIMLQQTQVATVIPFYLRFIAAFPNIHALASASEEQVLACWSGLGYYARARNLRRAAQIIVEKYKGEFPRRYEQILELPGIGRSTAAAIGALAYADHLAILDGNVKRVLARYCGISGWAGEQKVAARLWQQADALLPSATHVASGDRVDGGVPNTRIATYTQAMMDLGATVCVRHQPRCGMCPVRTDCVALQTGRLATLPSPRPRKIVPERQATFVLLMHEQEIWLEKRLSSGIWGGLWCPPQFDHETAARDWFERTGLDATGGERLAPFTHAFTHFRLHITPLKIRLARKPVQAAQPGGVWLDVTDALDAAIPVPVRQLLLKVKPTSAGR
ncbi:A/G-specific adenine glycosylase [Ferrigenium sp. UT5]|uniref:A/G-specific adenine glycosylase n=1 Tax=Ferrigenium sp. UT5 TaxID=3242105 RepID=UPI003550E3BC